MKIDLYRCSAPINGDDTLCGAPAPEERVIEGVVCHLCAKHAAEVDRDDETPEPTN